ncbi:DUF2461 domain-containing protein [Luethyella okanaganae]|uniref:DUF2461 domain-containing protein n=1 Tax=Luethyella okanaganae TaxID=69372 RepID=A0ABW1VG80_9MICO
MAAATEGFAGWPASGLDFYSGLEADNSKTYWNENKDVYEASVLAPMRALLEELAEEFGEGKIFRPNRDIRFSADKSPYKTAIGATLRTGGYVQFSANGLAVGAGCHMMAPDQLERYRAAAAEERSGEELVRAIAEVENQGIEVAVRESLKSAPRGYPKDHPRAELLRNKDLAAWKQWPIDGWLHTGGAKTHVVDALHGSRPLTLWLDAHVGPTTIARTR